jgi:hypothetical protein
MFRMHFQGLITHAKLDDGWVAVVFNEQQHAPILTVKNTDIIEATAPPAGDNPGKVTCFDLIGRMRLTNVQGGPVTATLNGVPHLTSLCDGTHQVRSDIQHRRPSNLFVAYLDFEGGLLSVDDWFESNVTFNGAGLRCLPRTVLYSTHATTSSVILSLDVDNPDPMQRFYVEMHPSADVWVTNLDISGAEVPDEYAIYKNFFYDATTIQVPIAVEAVPCSFGTPPAGRDTCQQNGTLGVQCSNNQFP